MDKTPLIIGRSLLMSTKMANILVVDDSLFIRKMIGDMIQEAGHTVIGEATDGNEAMMQYLNLKPDLVIMDITMPYMTGIEGLKMIKKMDPKAKVIMCSAMGQKSMIIEAIQLGASDYVIKPIKKSRLISTINHVLGV